jgi:uncharacterized membrane protein
MPVEERTGGGAGGQLGDVLERNIQALIDRRRAQEKSQRRQDRIADRIGRFAGSMTFVWIHAALFAVWIGLNVGWLPGPRFDPDFVKLATFASVEAIFLTTFVLVTQNRMAALANKRGDLDVQISLLAEHELTRLIRLVEAMGRKMGVHDRADEVTDLEHDVAPETVLDRIERAERGLGKDPGPPP